MDIVLHILFFISAAVLVVATLLQGGGMNLFSQTKERGIEKIVSKVTLIAGICFMTFAILIKIL